MSVNTTTHLNFRGDAREALEFYRSVFGGELMVATYSDFGAPEGTPDADKIVFGQVVAETGFRVMAYDVPAAGQSATPSEPSTRRENGMTITREPFFVSVRGDGGSVDEVTGYWEKLSEGASIVEPLASSQWAPLFGMLTDRFGVTWILDVAADYDAS